WEGSCGSLFGENRKVIIAPAKAVTTGVWRKNVNPTLVWAGDMTESDSPNWPLEVEIYDKGSGVLRTEYGWFPVSEFTATAKAVNLRSILPIRSRRMTWTARLCSVPQPSFLEKQLGTALTIVSALRPIRSGVFIAQCSEQAWR